MKPKPRFLTHFTSFSMSLGDLGAELVAHQDARRLYLAERPAAIGAGAREQRGRRLADVSHRPIQVTDEIPVEECPPLPRGRLVHRAVTGGVRRSVLGYEQRGAAVERLLRIVAQPLAMRVRVEVQRVGHVGSRDRVRRGLGHLLRPVARADDDDVVRIVLANRIDDGLVIRLEHFRPRHIQRLVVRLVENVGRVAVASRHVGEKCLGLGADSRARCERGSR